MKKPAVRRILHLTGRVLALAGIVFVVFRLRLYWSEIDLARIALPERLFIAVLSMVSSLSVLLLALIWRHILQALQASIFCCWTVKTYCVAQLAKYLPGNVFHYAARQATGMAANISAATLAKSFAWEIAVSIAAGLNFGVLALPLLFSQCAPWMSVLLFMLVAGCAFLCLQHIANKQMAAAFLLQLCFLLIMGGIFASLLYLVSEAPFPHSLWPSLIGAYIIAWLIGMMTPGASGGIGVREAVALFLLKGLVPESTLLLAVVLARMVSVVGDVFAFLIGHGFALFSKKDIKSVPPPL